MDVHPPNKWYFHRYWSIAILIFSVLSCIKLYQTTSQSMWTPAFGHRIHRIWNSRSSPVHSTMPAKFLASLRKTQGFTVTQFVSKTKDVASLETNCGNMVAPRLCWLMFPIYESWQSTFLPWNPVVKAKHVWSCQKMMRIVGYICFQT